MPPNTELKGIVQKALPFDDPVYKKGGADGSKETGAVYHPAPSRQQDVADEDEPPAVRITTRARITYEIDRFSKNTMLIIDNSEVSPTPVLLEHSFRRRRFEVTVVNAVEGLHNKTFVWDKILTFFQQDFSLIGAAAVVMLTKSGVRPAVSLSDGRIEEWQLLSYFMDNQPPGLQGKPKIFITEALYTDQEQCDQPILYPERRAHTVSYMEATGSANTSASHPHIVLPNDILLIQAKASLVKQDNGTIHRRPLNMLCFNLLYNLKDRGDLYHLVTDVFRRSKQRYPTITSPIKYHSTLTKELLLEKSENETNLMEDVNVMCCHRADYSRMTAMQTF